MTMRNAFANLATETNQLSDRELQEGVLYAMLAILEKMPRIDTADRIVTNQETGSVSISSGTVTTVTTVGTVSNQTNIGGRDAAHASFAMANIGALHIYNNILVTA